MQKGGAEMNPKVKIQIKTKISRLVNSKNWNAVSRDSWRRSYKIGTKQNVRGGARSGAVI